MGVAGVSLVEEKEIFISSHLRQPWRRGALVAVGVHMQLVLRFAYHQYIHAFGISFGDVQRLQVGGSLFFAGSKVIVFFGVFLRVRIEMGQ